MSTRETTVSPRYGPAQKVSSRPTMAHQPAHGRPGGVLPTSRFTGSHLQVFLFLVLFVFSLGIDLIELTDQRENDQHAIDLVFLQREVGNRSARLHGPAIRTAN